MYICNIKCNKPIKMKRPIVISFLLFLILLTSCKKTDDQGIPNVYVNFQINPNSTEYLELNLIGGFVYVTGGVKGLIIYREDMENFMCYDRACPYDYDVNGSIITVDTSGLILVDTLCGSKYLITDGSVVNGPTSRSLKQYRTYFNGEMLHIYN